jgi:integrase
VTFAAPKTARSRRTVALDPTTVAALRAHREAQLLERSFVAEGYVDRDLVFAREDGTPIYPQRLSEAFRQHIAAAGLPRIRLHDLRHTHATHALTSGVPVHVVAARIGDDPAIVLRTYSHLLPSSDAEAVERVAALVR